MCSCECVRRSVRAPLKARRGVIRSGLQGDSDFPLSGPQGMRPGGRNALEGGLARRRSHDGSSGGRLVPCCSLVQWVFQWSAEPNSPVTQRSRWRFPSTPCLKPVSWGLIGGSWRNQGSGLSVLLLPSAPNHSLIVQIRYCDSAGLLFESDLLIYPAGMFWRRFGIFGLVGEKTFSAKFICMGEGGGVPRF